VTITTGYPIGERYEDFLDELTGRGVRDFIWLAYAPWPGDRKLVEPYGALYSIYDMYTDLFPEGPRKAEGWKPEWVRYESPGVIKRGYWNSTRCLPNLISQWPMVCAGKGTLGRDGKPISPHAHHGLYNLKIFKQKVKPTALYLDMRVIVARTLHDYHGRYPLSNIWLGNEGSLSGQSLGTCRFIRKWTASRSRGSWTPASSAHGRRLKRSVAASNRKASRPRVGNTTPSWT
jgi:hypothetical protein